jgi:hypothetical protein
MQMLKMSFLIALAAVGACALSGCRVERDAGGTTVDGPNVRVDH